MSRSRAAAAVACAAAAAAVRLLGSPPFSNDHFYYLSRAEQVFHGAWPVRDFVDPGFPLMWALSALAQLVGGHTLLAEAVLVAAAFGVSAGLTLWVVFEWTGRLSLALWAASVELAVMPRSYSYPKILMYVTAAGALFRFARRPSVRGAAVLGAVTGAAFLFRHDHGVYVGAGAAVLVAFGDDGWRPAVAVRRLAVFAAAAGTLVVPYLLYVQLAGGGLVPYFRGALQYSQRDAGRTGVLTLPALDGLSPLSVDGICVIAYYVLWLTPAIAALVAWIGRHIDRESRWVVTGVAVTALLMNSGILRDPLSARVPDAIAPFVILAAWLAAEALRARLMPSRRWMVRAALAAAALLTVSAAVRVGNFVETLDRAELLHRPPRPLLRWRELSAQLREPYAERQMPSDIAFALVPFFEYARECAPPDARILVTGYLPEVSYYARRGFAGGHASLYNGYYSTADDQRQTVERLQHERVLFVVHSPEGTRDFARSFPIVNEYVRLHFAPLAEFPVDGDSPAAVYVDRDAMGSAPYRNNGWPCPAAVP